MAADEHVRQWLARRLTGCAFAAWLAQRGGAEALAFTVFDDIARATAENLDRAFDFAAVRHVPAIAVFPSVRTESDLLAVLHAVGSGERWTLSIENPEGLTTEEIMLGIQWRTKAGLGCLPMGLAPFATMPVTRRAPHVCIAVWPGGHENTRWTRYAKDTVDFLDTRLDPPGMDAASYKKRWKQSETETARYLADPPDDPKHYRRVAFRLSADVRTVANAAVSESRR